MSKSKKETKQGRLARLIIRLNNWRRRKGYNLNPEHVLLLLPSCMQSSECQENIVNDINNCKRCGNCKVKNVVELAEELGVVVFVATGGRIALMKVLDSGIKGVVAVACELELKAGIMASPKPVVAVTNLRPNGPCTNTDVNMDEVRGALMKFIDGPEHPTLRTFCV